MRISDWSSDVCSSDLGFEPGAHLCLGDAVRAGWPAGARPGDGHHAPVGRRFGFAPGRQGPAAEDRKSVVLGKSVSVRVDLGCRRFLKTTSSYYFFFFFFSFFFFFFFSFFLFFF